MDANSLTSIAVYSHALAAVCFFVLGVPMLAGWRARPHGLALAAACLLTSLWAGLLALSAWRGELWSVASDAAGILRNAAWMLFLALLAGRVRDPHSRLPLRLRKGTAVAALGYTVLFGMAVLGHWDLAHSGLGLVPVTLRVGLAIAGMLLVEQVYRSRSLQERWAVKFACLGIGAMFAYDFYLFSHAMLFREIDPDIWAARGIVNALSVPLLVVALGRSKLWESPLAVSRRAMFHSAALFGSATANWLTIAYAFPPQLRATGLGFATTAGRVGSIGGPIAGGWLLDQGLTVAAVCAALAVPAVLSAITFSRARRMEPGR